MPAHRCYPMRIMRYLSPILLLCFPAFAAQNPVESGKSPAGNPPPIAVAAPASVGVTITAEQWARPRSGDSIVKLPGLGALVETVERDAASHLVIRFAGGDEGSLWAEELRSWLVALGLPSARVMLEPGLPQPDRLLLELRPPR